MTRGVQQRHWWHWPVITVLAALTVYGVILIMSGNAGGGKMVPALREPI
jgi:hypothetical protein